MKNLFLVLVSIFSNFLFAKQQKISSDGTIKLDKVSRESQFGMVKDIFEEQREQFRKLDENRAFKNNAERDAFFKRIEKAIRIEDSMVVEQNKGKVEFQKEYEKKAYERDKKLKDDSKVIKSFWTSILSIILIVLAYFITKKIITKIKSSRKLLNVNSFKNSFKRVLMKLNSIYVNISNSKYFNNLKTSEIIVMSVIFGVLCSYLLRYLFRDFYIVIPSFLICGGICFLYLSKKDS
jgi:hypothetical protein